MKIQLLAGLLVILLGTLTTQANACCKHEHQCSDSNAANVKPLERMQNLAGYWESTKVGENGKKEVVIYKPTANGSAVQEILMPSSENEMISMYSKAGDELYMTHYCALGNQPRLKAMHSDDPNKINFDFVDGINIDPTHDMHMHSLTISFLDKNHIRQEWTAFKDGKPIAPKVFDFIRCKL